MKKIFISIFTSIIALCSVAQNLPQGIAYQAVAVKDGSYTIAGQNPSAIYWANKEIKVRFTIFERYPNGSPQFSEVHSTTTDDFGVFNLIIGQGSPLSGDFQSIPWGIGDAHLQVEIDFENTNTYTLTSIEKFWSVPYAFVTNEENSFNTDSAIQAINTKITYLRNRDQDTVIGNEGIEYSTIDSLNDVFNKTILDLNQVLQSKIDVLRANDLDTVVGNEIQSLSIKGDSLTISKGNTVTIDFPINMDNDSTNEIQTISISNDTISLSNGGGKIGLDKIKTYIDSTSASNNDNNGSENSGDLGSGVNSFCLDGTLIDLSTWANSKAIESVFLRDVMSDSIVMLNDKYIHNLKTNKFIELPVFNGNYIQFNDSVIYIQREITRQQSKIAVYKLKKNFTLDSVTSFSLSNTLLTYWYQGDAINSGFVNKSNDLVWISLIQRGGGNYTFKVKKFDYSSKSLLTYTNFTTTYGSNFFKLVSGDTAIIRDKLYNTNTMTQIRSMPTSFNGQFSGTKASMFNGKLIYSHNYHNRDYNNQIYYNGVFEYDLNTGVSKTILPNSPEVETYNFDILGEHNGKLWISISAKQIRWSWGTYNDYNPGTYFFKNLILDTKGTSIISISKNGFAQLEVILKYSMGGSSLLGLNDIGIRPGTENNSRNRLSFPIRADARYSSYLLSYKGPPCLNNEVAPLNNGPGYFYSNK